MKTLSPKARYFWPLLLILFVSDCSTKDLVVEHLADANGPQSVIDSFVRLNLVHNPGTAFGFDIRPRGRPAPIAHPHEGIACSLAAHSYSQG